MKKEYSIGIYSDKIDFWSFLIYTIFSLEEYRKEDIVIRICEITSPLAFCFDGEGLDIDCIIVDKNPYINKDLFVKNRIPALEKNIKSVIIGGGFYET